MIADPRPPYEWESPALVTLGRFLEPERPRPYRPPVARLTGPLGGSLVTSDPARLRWEAEALLALADALEAEQGLHPPPTLFLL